MYLLREFDSVHSKYHGGVQKTVTLLNYDIINPFGGKVNM